MSKGREENEGCYGHESIEVSVEVSRRWMGDVGTLSSGSGKTSPCDLTWLTSSHPQEERSLKDEIALGRQLNGKMRERQMGQGQMEHHSSSHSYIYRSWMKYCVLSKASKEDTRWSINSHLCFPRQCFPPCGYKWRGWRFANSNHTTISAWHNKKYLTKSHNAMRLVSPSVSFNAHLDFAISEARLQGHPTTT